MKNLPINASTRICTNHFINAAGSRLQPDEYPSVNIPTSASYKSAKKMPTLRTAHRDEAPSKTSDEEVLQVANVGVQASDNSQEAFAKNIQFERTTPCFKILFGKNISKDDNKVSFTQCFPNYPALKICYDYLGLAVDNLTYWGSKRELIYGCQDSDWGNTWVFFYVLRILHYLGKVTGVLTVLVGERYGAVRVKFLAQGNNSNSNWHNWALSLGSCNWQPSVPTTEPHSLCCCCLFLDLYQQERHHAGASFSRIFIIEQNFKLDVVSFILLLYLK